MTDCKQCGRDHSKDPSPFDKLNIPEETIDVFLRKMLKELYDFVGAELKIENDETGEMLGKASPKHLHAINDLLVTLNTNYILSTGDSLVQTLQLYRVQGRQARNFLEAGLMMKYGVEVDVSKFRF